MFIHINGLNRHLLRLKGLALQCRPDLYFKPLPRLDFGRWFELGETLQGANPLVCNELTDKAAREIFQRLGQCQIKTHAMLIGGDAYLPPFNLCSLGVRAIQQVLIPHGLCGGRAGVGHDR